MSVQPKKLEKKIGDAAYPKCKTYRIIATVFEIVVVVAYIFYYFFPLPIKIARYFPWSWWISIIIAAVIGIPNLWIMMVGIKDAGEEALAPKKEHKMYSGGIYEKIRHPQAVGETFLWLMIAFFLHSPFLVIYSIIWFPIFYLFCVVEEKDLVLRYGKPYKDYQKAVGMLFPKAGFQKSHSKWR
jgi:protein-S-isoprenylcysteine O-methyltransferase Ste14